MAAISVLLVDENPVFLRIAARLLAEWYSDDLSVVGVAQSRDDALYQACTLEPSLVLLGLGQYNLKTLQLVPQLRMMLPGVHIIVLGMLDSLTYQRAAIDAGADAFVAKAAVTHRLMPMIWRVLQETPDNICKPAGMVAPSQLNGERLESLPG